MRHPFRSVAVLGAGTMGAQIAAHLANAGVPVSLLDLTRDAAAQGVARLKTTKPDPCFLPDTAARIRVGGFDDVALVAEADWVIEAIVESLEIKQHLIGRLAPHFSPGVVVSSNPSGIPLSAIAAGLPAALRRRWLGTHFFNPPRYLRLVEIIPTPDTDPAVTARVAEFVDHRLGKGVIVAKDTPGFIANRIGMFGAVRSLEALASGELTVEDIDVITGPIIGRPKSATFRTMDIAGLDIVAKVAADLAARLADVNGARDYAAPPLVAAMLERGQLGEKSGRGFYQRVKGADGSTILALDPVTLEYRAQQKTRLPSIEVARANPDTGARLRALFLGADKAGAFLRHTLGATLLYAARIAPDIAHAIDDIDRAMRWGFGWELGPFETWDAIGLDAVLQACAVTDPPPLIRDAIAAGRVRLREAPLPPAGPGLLILGAARTRGIVKQNAGASLVDLGDGVLSVEFHSKMNTIGGDVIDMLNAGVAEASSNYMALVVGNDADHFSAGANLMLLLLEAQEGNWDEIDLMVRAFQNATMGLKLAPVPVIVAPAGLAIGGGCEICLHGDRVQAAAESYIGLVEVGVGLIPAGGGTKELLIRAMDRAAKGDAFPWVQAAFETIGFGKVSTSAPDARRLGYLRDLDGVTMNRERVMADAKAQALARAALGYQPPAPRAAVPVGGADTLATLSLGVHLAHRAGRVTDHEAVIGRKLAWILAGGNAPHATTVSERYLLDLEREAFLSLCGERKTLERMAHTLKTGKTLRN